MKTPFINCTIIKEKWKMLLIILIFCSGLSIGLYIVISNIIRNNHITREISDNSKFIEILSLQFSLLSRILQFGEEYSNLFKFNETMWKTYIKLSGLENLNNILFIDELRLHYYVDNNNKTEYETYMSTQLGRDINIFQVELNGSFVQGNYDFYCPLTYISPNISNILHRYIGSDICHIATYTNYISTLNKDPNIHIQSRVIIRNNAIILDVGKKINNGFIIVSILVDDLIKNINKRLTRTYHIKLLENNNVLIDNSIAFSRRYEQIITFFNQKYDIILYYNDKQKGYLEFLIPATIVLYLCTASIFLYINKYRELQIKVGQYEFANELLGYVNHELRNPLNSILGLLQICIDDFEQTLTNNTIESIKSNLKTAEQSCIMINHIVNDILDMAKLQKGKLQIEYTTFSTKMLFIDIRKILLHKITEHPSIKFSYNTNIDYITIDKYRLIQILINFLTNSYKFTDSGYIKLSIIQEDNIIKYSVVDSGIGISNEKKQLLFKPYEQVNIQDSIRHGGMGLGLYICKMLAELMHLEIGVNDNPEGGSEFYIVQKIQTNIHENTIEL